MSASLPPSDLPRTLQWVNTQMLLCRKCNNNQTSKIKQLASFTPRDDVRMAVGEDVLPQSLLLPHGSARRRSPVRDQPLSDSTSR